MKTEYRIEFIALTQSNKPLFAVNKYVDGKYHSTLIDYECALTCHQLVKDIVSGEAVYTVESKTSKINN